MELAERGGERGCVDPRVRHIIVGWESYNQRTHAAGKYRLSKTAQGSRV